MAFRWSTDVQKGDTRDARSCACVTQNFKRVRSPPDWRVYFSPSRFLKHVDKDRKLRVDSRTSILDSCENYNKRDSPVSLATTINQRALKSLVPPSLWWIHVEQATSFSISRYLSRRNPTRRKKAILKSTWLHRSRRGGWNIVSAWRGDIRRGIKRK